MNVGDRVELVSTSDEYTQLQPGEQGTIDLIDSLGTLHVKWDNGARLGLIPGEDHWREVRAYTREDYERDKRSRERTGRGL